MKITEQTLHELLLDPHTVAELIAAGRDAREPSEAIAFYHHVEQCPACSNHIKAMCNEGRRLLQEWAVSYLDARVN